MIRKVIVSVLTLAAVAMLPLEVASFACRSPYPFPRIGADNRDLADAMLRIALTLPGSGREIVPPGSWPHSVQGVFKLSELEERGILGIHCCRGRFAVGYAGFVPTETRSYSGPVVIPEGRVLALADQWLALPNTPPLRLLAVRGALWFLFLVFAAYPTFCFIRGPWRRRQRRKKGLCVNCGYSLTGLSEPRCPECGHAF